MTHEKANKAANEVQGLADEIEKYLPEDFDTWETDRKRRYARRLLQLATLTLTMIDDEEKRTENRESGGGISFSA